MLKLSLLPLFAATFLIASATPQAQAADHEFCRDYAESAVRQFNYAERHERCEGYIRADRNRWQENFKVHYEWCRNVSNEAAWQQRRLRKEALESCRGHDHFDDYR